MATKRPPGLRRSSPCSTCRAPNAVRCPRTRPPGTSPTCGRRERRVHYDGVVKLVRRKKIVETVAPASCRWAGGITGRPASWLCQARATCESLKRQQAQPTLVDLVCIDLSAGQSCQDCDVARALAGFEHLHSGSKRRRLHEDERLGRRRAELLELDLNLIAFCLPWQSRLLGDEPLNRGAWIAQVKPDALYVDVESGFGGVIRIACASGRRAEYLASQSRHLRVVKGAGRLRFHDGCESKRKLPFRTLTRRRGYD